MRRRDDMELDPDESTVRKPLTGNKTKQCLKKSRSREARHCKNLHGRIFGLTLSNRGEVNDEISEANNSEPPFNKAAKTAGRD
jgi:hypothetical protein